MHGEIYAIVMGDAILLMGFLDWRCVIAYLKPALCPLVHLVESPLVRFIVGRIYFIKNGTYEIILT